MRESSLTKMSGDYLPELVLIEWADAITRFHKHFYELLAVLNQPVSKPHLNVTTTPYMGRPSVSPGVGLHKLMEDELIRLSQDIHPTRELSGAAMRKHYKMLIHHTTVLNQLNQRAQSALYLATQSNS